ncbi:MAG: PQQ-binding-like beta-propeller repeat protein [Phycisphaeraceae bacterium]|nr:PQQ-binding-like beta-propeller repeat protein [Phycisphaeraceae bacterium]
MFDQKPSGNQRRGTMGLLYMPIAMLLAALLPGVSSGPVHADPPRLLAEEVRIERPERYTRYTVTLTEALPGDRDLVLHLGHDDGGFGHAWAGLPDGKQLWNKVDASGLRVEGNRLRGEVRSQVQLPGDEHLTDMIHELDMAIEGREAAGRYSGWYGIRGQHMVIMTDSLEVSREDLRYFTYGEKYEGRVEGSIVHRAADTSEFQLELNLGSVLIGGPADRFRRVGLNMRVRDGALRGGEVFGTDLHEGSWRAEIRRTDLKIGDQRIRGEVEIEVESSDASGITEFGDDPIPPGYRGHVKSGTYTFILDGRMQGNTVVGTLRSKYHHLDVPIPANNFSGTIETLIQRPIHTGNAIYVIRLRRAIENTEDLVLQLDRSEGKWSDAFAIGRGGGGLSRVDALGLEIRGDHMRGDVVVHLHPGSGFLPGDEPLTVTYAVDTWLGRGWRGFNYSLGGTYKTTYGKRNEVEGTAAARVEDARTIRARNAVREDLGWPTWHGPNGAFAAQRAGHELVDSLDEARLDWVSRPTPGARSQITRYHQRNVRRELDRGPTGGGSSVVVADGRVYLFYFRPVGEAGLWTYIRRETALGRRVVPSQWRTKADDIVLCVDAATGQTLWKTTYHKGGIYWEPGKDTYTSTPAVADGRVFAMGTSGWIYALDAATGERLWEQPLPWARGAARRRAEAMENQAMVGGSPTRGASRIVVDDLLIAPDFGGGLIAFDVATGERRWHARNSGATAATPVPWRHNGQTYILSPHGTDGQVVCVDAATGEVAWRIEDARTTGYDLAVADDMLVLQRRSEDGPYLAAYRINAEGFEEAWSLSHELGGIDGRPVVINDGIVYAQLDSGVTLIDPRNGRVLARDDRRRGSASTMVWAEDRLFLDLDATHSRTWQRMYDARPDHFRTIHNFWNPPHHQTSAYYRRVLAHPIVDGRIFLRGTDGIYCYDLRKEQE